MKTDGATGVNTEVEDSDEQVRWLTESLGEVIRERRNRVGLRLVDLAQATGLSQAFLSQVENGSAPSLITLHRIAVALDTDVHSLLEVSAKATLTVVRSGEGKPYPLMKGATIRFLAEGSGHALEANEVVADPGSAMQEDTVHNGEEFLFILEGTVELQVEGEDHVELRPGDAAFYPSRRAHRVVVGNEPARLLWVNVPGTF
jgi:transcriptional regulator with XRE-family HTH domain